MISTFFLFFLLIVLLGLQIATLVITNNHNNTTQAKLATTNEQFQSIDKVLNRQEQNMVEWKTELTHQQTQTEQTLSQNRQSQLDQKEEFYEYLRNPYTLNHLGTIGQLELYRLKEKHEEKMEAVKVNYSQFAQACLNAAQNDTDFQTFRQNKFVLDMLEHVPAKLCPEYMQILSDLLQKSQLTELPWDIILEHDQIGQPTVETVLFQNQTNITISPTTLRYVVFAIKVLQQIKETNQAPLHIIEIGGGYGGQCAMFHKLAHLFDISIDSYIILDLKEPHALQARFLATQLTPDEMQHMFFKHISDRDLRQVLHEKSFLFSAYAYSEIAEIHQIGYNVMLQGFINHGFLLWNSIQMPLEGFYQMINKTPKDIKIQPEFPKTGPFNYVYTF